MSQYFKRQNQLWGEQTQEFLRQKSVLIVGAGGLGSGLCACLSGLGLGKIFILDHDLVSLSNIHRQICFSLNDENKPKVQVAKSFINARETGVSVEALQENILDFKQDLSVDLVLDATDNFEARIAINAYAKRLSLPWIYASVEEFNAQVAFFEKSSFKAFNTTKISPKGIAAPMVLETASFSANLATRFLAKMPVAKDLLYYIYYDKNGEKKLKSFKLPSD